MHEEKENLGYKIRQLRKSKGWTQEQLAEMLGIDNKHLSRIEMGYHMPNYQVIKKLAQVFDFDLRTFDESNVDELPKPDKITQKSIQIISSAKSEEEKKYFLEVLQLAQKGVRLNKE